MFKLVIVVASLANPDWTQRFEVDFPTVHACELTRKAPGVWWNVPQPGKLVTVQPCEASI